MNWNDLLTALALVLILEGAVPFISPQGYKNFMQRLGPLSNDQLRTMGFGLMILGVISLFLVR